MTKLLQVKSGYYRVQNTKGYDELDELNREIVLRELNCSLDEFCEGKDEERLRNINEEDINKIMSVFKSNLAVNALRRELLKDIIENGIVAEGINIRCEYRREDSSSYLRYGDTYISVKATTRYSNLLLIPENEVIDYRIDKIKGLSDYFVLIRIDMDEKSIKKNLCNYFKNQLLKTELENNIFQYINNVTYDIPGYITRDDFLMEVLDEQVILEGEVVGKSEPFIKNNYYVLAADMREFIDLQYELFDF